MTSYNKKKVKAPAGTGKKPAQGTKSPADAKAEGAHQRPIAEDMIAMRILRDPSVREKVYFQNKAMIVISAALIVSILANVMLFLRPPDVRYFATTTDGKIMKMSDLAEPVQNTSAVLNWATRNITNAYTFSFANYRQQLQAARPSFTKSGWDGFNQALQESGNLQSVINNDFVTTVVPSGAPVIIAEGYMSGRYAWQIEMPILVTYQSANERFTQDLLVQAIVVRRPELENPSGLGIAQIIAE